ncbi:hypothetical protein AN639_01025 [Candidatus Epulonipiscium fishelsonii]|uniref:Uncharacterized protein n=1 Tax=Candidatus Epulonipiscium fishelsonii TaxID=77094 RepID=A0ACC8XC94_9FIRM|nr:hypothetical protein AN396_06200 [Epulopiscium sp. SCG-B11WGA-EpuloA1]ONI41376.1 hypothetical protein AN639_01025 [Epulopiscium sp. SCG-B05WGA-EpuloA1]
MFDYHIHSKYSKDGCEKIITLCEEAIKKGLEEIAITDHYELYQNPSVQHCMDFKGLYEDIKNCREVYKNILSIKMGVEMGQPHHNLDLANQTILHHPFDFVMASIHKLTDKFDIGICNFEGIDFNKLYTDYLNALIKMTQTADFDILGHLTYPARYYFAHSKNYPDWTPFKSQFEYLFKELIRQDKGIEINCSEVFKPMGRTMPDLNILALYKECGGKILTIGCDSHRHEFLGSATNDGIKVAQQAGFSEITKYTNRIPTFSKI